METAKGMVARAIGSGRLQICGEMELPYPCGYENAKAITNVIAEECGYIAIARRSRITITGNDINGAVQLDWAESLNAGPSVLTIFQSDEAIFPSLKTEETA